MSHGTHITYGIWSRGTFHSTHFLSYNHVYWVTFPTVEIVWMGCAKPWDWRKRGMYIPWQGTERGKWGGRDGAHVVIPSGPISGIDVATIHTINAIQQSTPLRDRSQWIIFRVVTPMTSVLYYMDGWSPRLGVLASNFALGVGGRGECGGRGAGRGTVVGMHTRWSEWSATGVFSSPTLHISIV